MSFLTGTQSRRRRTRRRAEVPNKEGVTLGAQACRRQDQFTSKGYIWSRDGNVAVRRLGILMKVLVSLKKRMMLSRGQGTSMRQCVVDKGDCNKLGTSGSATEERAQRKFDCWLSGHSAGWLIATNTHILHDRDGRHQSLHSVRKTCLTCRSGNSP